MFSDDYVKMSDPDSDANGNFSLVEQGPLRDSLG